MPVRFLPPQPTTSNKKPAELNLQSPDAAPGDLIDLQKQSPESFTAPRTLVLFVLVLIPFWIVPLAHLLSEPRTATGFFQYELPYYVANGRAAFERGNGVMYPNPYDASSEAPAIYTHWLPWTLGLLTAKAGCDPGDVILALTLFASLAFAWTTQQLVSQRIRRHNNTAFAFLLAMWGGGLLALAGSILCLLQTTPWLENVLQFDPGNGMWFLNWGRNSLFPTEAIYHSLVALCWLSEIRQKQTMANIWLLLLVTTHPWSGLELLLTINLWRVIELLRHRDCFSLKRFSETWRQFGLKKTSRCCSKSDLLEYSSLKQAINQVSISAVTLIVFLAYYKIWLPSFTQHAELQNVWELNWSVSWTAAGLAYLPVLIPAAIVLTGRSRTGSLDRTEQFLACALFIATGLAFHDRVIKPVQPIHFTRGYIWMPLLLLGLPVILKWFGAANNAWPQRRFAGLLLFSILIADNFAFAMVHFERQFSLTDGFHMNGDERALCDTLHQSPETANRIVLTESETLNYLLPTYARVRPWLGHHFNTPDFPARKEIWDTVFQNNDITVCNIPTDVSVIVVRQTRDVSQLATSSLWSPTTLQNAEWQIWCRVAPSEDADPK